MKFENPNKTIFATIREKPTPPKLFQRSAIPQNFNKSQKFFSCQTKLDFAIQAQRSHRDSDTKTRRDKKSRLPRKTAPTNPKRHKNKILKILKNADKIQNSAESPTKIFRTRQIQQF